MRLAVLRLGRDRVRARGHRLGAEGPFAGLEIGDHPDGLSGGIEELETDSFRRRIAADRPRDPIEALERKGKVDVYAFSRSNFDGTGGSKFRGTGVKDGGVTLRALLRSVGRKRLRLTGPNKKKVLTWSEVGRAELAFFVGVHDTQLLPDFSSVLDSVREKMDRQRLDRFSAIASDATGDDAFRDEGEHNRRLIGPDYNGPRVLAEGVAGGANVLRGEVAGLVDHHIRLSGSRKTVKLERSVGPGEHESLTTKEQLHERIADRFIRYGIDDRAAQCIGGR